MLVWVLETMPNTKTGTMVRIKNTETNEVLVKKYEHVLRFNADLWGTYEADKSELATRPSPEGVLRTDNLDCSAKTLDPIDRTDELSVRAHHYLPSRINENPGVGSQQGSPDSSTSEKKQWDWKKGIMLAVPSYDGTGGAEKLKAYLKRVKIWSLITKDLISPKSQVNHLLGALKDKAARTLDDDNDVYEWTEYGDKDGVQKYTKRVADLFGEGTFAELSSRLDDFFDSPMRGCWESLQDYCDRFENQYQKLADLGESLSDSVKLNRLLKGSRLNDRTQKGLTRNCGAVPKYQSVVEQLRFYSEAHQRSVEQAHELQHWDDTYPDVLPPPGHPLRPRKSRNGGFQQKRKEVADTECKESGINNKDLSERNATTSGGSPVYEQAEKEKDSETHRYCQDAEERTELEAFTFQGPEAMWLRRNGYCESELWTRPVIRDMWAYDILKKGGPESPQEVEVLKEVKTRTRCVACGQIGHWRGERMCPEVHQEAEVEKNIEAGTKRKPTSDEDHCSGTVKNRPQEKSQKRQNADLEHLLLQQSKKEAERLLSKYQRKRAREDTTSESEDLPAHICMIKQLEKEAEEDSEIYDQLGKIYAFESDRFFTAISTSEPATRGTGTGNCGSIFESYIKGTYHDKTHLLNFDVIELFVGVGKDWICNRHCLTSFFVEPPNREFMPPAVPSNKKNVVPCVPRLISGTSKRKCVVGSGVKTRIEVPPNSFSAVFRTDVLSNNLSTVFSFSGIPNKICGQSNKKTSGAPRNCGWTKQDVGEPTTVVGGLQFLRTCLRCLQRIFISAVFFLSKAAKQKLWVYHIFRKPKDEAFKQVLFSTTDNRKKNV